MRIALNARSVLIANDFLGEESKRLFMADVTAERGQAVVISAVGKVTVVDFYAADYQQQILKALRSS